MNQKNINGIDQIIMRLPDNRRVVENVLYSMAFANPTRLWRMVKKECGWQGGTIHQVIDYIMDRKSQFNNLKGNCQYKPVALDK